MKAAIRRVVGDAQIKPGKVKLDLPPLVENGNTVAMSVSVDSPMTAKDYVKAIHVFTEKNPQPNVISVQLGPRAGKARSPPASGLPTPRPCRDLRNVRWLVLVRPCRSDHHARRLPGGLI